MTYIFFIVFLTDFYFLFLDACDAKEKDAIPSLTSPDKEDKENIVIIEDSEEERK